MSNHTTELQQHLYLLQSGSLEAKSDLIKHSCDRLRVLTHRMLRNYPRVGRWSDTGDVLQAALMRLHRALDSVQPETPEKFYALAAMQIRRELLDLTKHFYGPEGRGYNHHSDSGSLLNENLRSNEPTNLVEWGEFHEQVNRLPPELTEVVELVWYKGLSQVDAAHVLNISPSSLKRRWAKARLELSHSLKEWMLS